MVDRLRKLRVGVVATVLFCALLMGASLAGEKTCGAGGQQCGSREGACCAESACKSGGECKHGQEACRSGEGACKSEVKPQTECPVMGGKIDRAIFADHEGLRIYFCCKGCVATFGKDPAKYIGKLEKDGVTIERIRTPQTLCPISGNKVDPAQSVDVAGYRIYTCCAECLEKVKVDPEASLKKIRENGEMPQRLCKAPACCKERGQCARCEEGQDGSAEPAAVCDEKVED